MKAPVLTDILDAKRVIDRYLQPTPMHHYPRLSQELGFDVFIKHENHQAVGAFKVRGGINLISRLSDEEKQMGVISASTGNHGQSVAYASRLFGVKATITVPENSNADKVAAMKALGTTVEVKGKDFDEARAWVEETHKARGLRYIHSANEPLLVAGVGTIGLEMIYARPDLDVVIAPIGGGSGAAGSSIAVKSINPQIRMVGVQSEHARVVHDSWREKRVLTGVSTTFAEGMATRQAFELTLGILIQNLDDFVLVSDDELRAAIRMIFEYTHNVAEGAGAASMAAAVKMRKELAGKKVGLDLSGGNITAETLKLIFS